MSVKNGKSPGFAQFGSIDVHAFLILPICMTLLALRFIPTNCSSHVYKDTAYTIYEYPHSINSLLSFRKYVCSNVFSAPSKGRLGGETLRQSFFLKKKSIFHQLKD